MAVTFLQAVNASLKRSRVIQGDAGELATSTVTSTATGLVATGAFTDSGRQTQIDLMLQMWNEAIHEVYSVGLFAKEAATATMDLVTAQREYDLPSDFERMAGMNYKSRVLRGVTTGFILPEYPGGYAQMLADQPFATQWTGEPQAWALSPVGNKIRLDREPTSDQNGDAYVYLYEKRLTFTSTMATDTLPFSDTVADSLVPVVAEGWNRVYKQEFDIGLFSISIRRAIEHLTQNQRSRRYAKCRNS